ncbi:SDR family NAD(P)-dependent oxidoreductase, partial [Streptomyces sp. NTH33]|uniref:SDR family NAD(P)-dependent oxidoreductase n=1 Tax=Streptomyces sp. NTH33 TaxID=1735453 RepID=UPI003F91698E
GAGASIINTTSVQAYKPSPHLLDYAMTKGGIVTFTQGLAQMVTPMNRGAAAPGAGAGSKVSKSSRFCDATS